MKKTLFVSSVVVRLTAVSILCLSAWGFAFSAASSARPQSGELFVAFQGFSPSKCMFDLPPGVKEGEQVVCGYVQTPLDHANPEGPVIELAVTIIKNSAPNPAPDPLFIAQGGPGGSTIETYATLLLTDNKLVSNRDIVLFDQRGTKFSRPNLYCDEIDQLIADTIEQDLSDEEAQALSIQAVEQCQIRLSSREKIDLAMFNSRQNAEDIEVIRQALGFPKINLYGVSYGTLLALHFMDRHPNSLRSVILDAVVPRQTNFILNSPKTMDRSFSALFESCRSDLACNQAYPDLEDVFFETVKKLNETPARIPLTDSETSITYQNAVINGDAFMSAVFQMLYAGALIPAMPRMIYHVHQGNFDFFSRIYSLLLFDRSMSLGMYYSVICAEDADFELADQDLSGVRPEISKMQADEPENLLKICEFWNAARLGAQADAPVASDVPTLLLSGFFDPITPPSYAEAAAQTLTNAYSYTNPAGGHGQAPGDPCASQLIQAFLDDPSRPPDPACASETGGPSYYTPLNTINFPLGLALLNFEQPAGVQFIILILCLGFLLTALLAIPLIWLLAWTRRRQQMHTAPSAAAPAPAILNPYKSPIGGTALGSPAQPSPSSSLLSKAAGWLAFIAGPILSAFLIGLGYILFKMALENNYQIFFGVPRSAAALFLLPFLFALVSLGMIAASIHSWLKRDWTVWTRIYYSLLTLSATACLVILIAWEVFGALV